MNSFLLLLLLASTAHCLLPRFGKRADYYIRRFQMTTFFPGQPYFSRNIPFGNVTSRLPLGDPNGVQRRAGSNLYVLFRPGNNLFPMHAFLGYDVFHHVSGFPVRFFIIDPHTGIMNNSTIGARQKDGRTVVIPAGHQAAWEFRQRQRGTFALFALTAVPEYHFGDAIIPTSAELTKLYPRYRIAFKRLAVKDPVVLGNQMGGS